ncbi:MAG: DUF3995 domain-containing protein [Pseudomonadota bacterium]
MNTLAIIVFLTLTAIAGLHLYWGFGGLWPAANEEQLIRTVIGAEWPRMPSLTSTAVVAALIFAAGLVGLLASGVAAIGPNWFWRIGAGVVAFVFLARGASGYFLRARGVEMTEPFSTYDVWLYSPLCLALGGAFCVIAARGAGITE